MLMLAKSKEEEIKALTMAGCIIQINATVTVHYNT